MHCHIACMHLYVIAWLQRYSLLCCLAGMIMLCQNPAADLRKTLRLTGV
jgi:hypothetical protein